MKHMSAKQIAYFILAVLLLLFTFIAANAQEPYIRVFPASEARSLDRRAGFFLADSGFRFPYFRPVRFHRKIDSFGHAQMNRADTSLYIYVGNYWMKMLSIADSARIAGWASAGSDVQTLSISNDTLSIIRGNSVKLPFIKISNLVQTMGSPNANDVLSTSGLNTQFGLYPTKVKTASDIHDSLNNLTAGTGISISGRVISNTSPSSGGTVTNVSVVSVNGISGTVANPSSTPALALSVDTIQSGTEQAGTIHTIAIADPATPQPNTGFAYMDATHHVWNMKNDAGVVSNTAIPNAGTSGQFFKTFSADGTFTLGTAVTSVAAGTGLSGGTITGTGTISLPNTGTAGTYGSSTQVAVITTDAQGRITSVTPTTITGFQVSGNYVTFSDTTISAAYTLTSRDAFRRIHATNGSNIALTIPSGLGTTFGCEVIQEGAGTVTPAGSGATLHFATSGHTKTGGQHSAISIQMEATTDNILIQGKTQ